MEIKDILNKCDHTLLSVSATWEQIKQVIDDGIKYQTASVCIPPAFIDRAVAYAEGGVKICTVIGFPNGYNTTAVKIAETEDALKNGADEIDMVINIGELKAGNYDYVHREISAIKKVCGDKILKVIVETCLLTKDEIIKTCEIVTSAGADFIKTSTGFSTGGATIEDVKLMKENVGEGVLVKASGGIKGISDAKEFISVGADRLGTSRVIKEVKENK
jgi:deoxyribose-phosphate aldolase